MRRSLTTLLVGLILAIFVATGLAVAVGLPFAGSEAGKTPGPAFLAMLPRVAAFSVVPALAAIWLAEMRRIRGIAYWALVGTSIAIAGWGSVAAGGAVASDGLHVVVAFFEFASIGLAAGCLYWWLAGRRSGGLAVAIEAASTLVPGASADHRCRTCTAVTLLIGLVPLALIGWSAIYRPIPNLIERLREHAETDAHMRLAAAGLTALSVKIDGGVGIVTGKAPSGTTTAAAFRTTQEVLAPLVGMPGIVARLENRIGNDSDAAEQH